jgi:ribosomal protein S18 acetylase RimI-like enzyme
VLSDAARNHESWFGRGREHVELDGVSLFLGPDDAVLAFPQSDGDLAGAVRIACDSGAKEVECWALEPDGTLGEKLRLQGFQDGWQPHWMGIDPRESREAPIHDVESTLECAAGLPYASAHHTSVLGGDVHHFVVRDEFELVGHAVLNIEGTSGGLYDMGVVPSARRRGFGSALTLAVLARGREEGCTSVTLNATGEGEPMYRRCGFESLGLGMTWWLFPHR